MIRPIIATVGFILSIAIFVGYTKGTYDNSKVIQAEIAQYDEALNRARQLQERKIQLLQQLDRFKPEDLARLEKLLPNHVDNVRLLLDLDSLASRYGLVLQNVNVEQGDRDGGSGTIAVGGQGRESATGVIGQQATSFDSLTFSFATEGTYEQFVEFMEALEKSLRIVDIESLSLARGSDDAGNSGELVYSFDVSLRTYWLK